MSYFAQEPDLILLSLSFSNLEDGEGGGDGGGGGARREAGSQKSAAKRAVRDKRRLLWR